MSNFLTNHYVRLSAEAALAGIVAFGITYQATGNLQASLIAALLAAMNKAAPPITGKTAVPTPPNTPVTPK